MKSKILNIGKYVFFLGLGVIIFWWNYKDEPFDDILGAFKEVNYFWIFISLIFSILSLVSRAMRWQILIKASGHKTRFYNVFLSCFILYFVNLLVPRAGEVARCSVVSSTEKVPFAKLVGTMVVERLADMIMLMLIALVVIPLKFADFSLIFSSNEQLTSNFMDLLSARNILIVSGIGILFLIALIIIYRFIRQSNHRYAQKIKSIWKTVREGVYSILHMKRKWEFIAHTLFIFMMWLAMLYVVFLAYEPTSKLSLMAGVVAFFMGGLAMLAPINGGIGAWHTMVIISLTGAYGISLFDAKVFAFIAHSATNLIYLLLGIFALIVLFFLNSGRINLSSNKVSEI